MKLRSIALLFTLTPLGFIGCGSSNETSPTTDAGTNVSDAGAGTADSGPDPGVLPFKPSNIDLSGMDLSTAGDVVISGANCGIADTEALSWSCVDKYAKKTLTLSDQSRLTVFVVKSLRVEASALVDVSGGQIPLVIVALDSMTLAGSLKVRPGKGGGAFNAQANQKGSGPGGGGGGAASQKAAGGGGSFCGVGGQGAIEPGGTAYAKSAAYGTPELVPLVGGSAGGAGAVGAFSGSGGGAIQLVAGKSIEIQAGAFVSAPGGGGNQGGLAGSQDASGGGSGGGILLEAPAVKVAGVLAANGGGGGEGAGGQAGGGESGDVGHDSDATPAAGGNAGTNNSGGNGAAGSTILGGDGMSTADASAAGAGGAAGRIRINSASGVADLGGGTLSPAVTTMCVSQGKLGS